MPGGALAQNGAWLRPLASRLVVRRIPLPRGCHVSPGSIRRTWDSHVSTMLFSDHLRARSTPATLSLHVSNPFIIQVTQHQSVHHHHHLQNGSIGVVEVGRSSSCSNCDSCWSDTWRENLGRVICSASCRAGPRHPFSPAGCRFRSSASSSSSSTAASPLCSPSSNRGLAGNTAGNVAGNTGGNVAGQASTRNSHVSAYSNATAVSSTQDGSPAASSSSLSSPLPSCLPSSSSGSNLIDTLELRGLVESLTSEELRTVVAQRSLSVYCGFDPTAESLHIGNLIGIIVLAWFQRYGHRPVALLGGATARIGDPSGKSVERPLLGDSTINKNLAKLRSLLERLLLNAPRGTEHDSSSAVSSPSSSPSAGPPPPPPLPLPLPLVLNNADWFSQFSMLDFLRDVGRHVRVGTMLGKESVRSRLQSESGLSFTEFCYQLLQGYDFVHLHKEHGVSVQVGGSDQWGNITAGTDLVRKLLPRKGGEVAVGGEAEAEAEGGGGGGGEGGVGGEEVPEGGPMVYGLTFPLLLQSDGRKFGKTESGAVWLSAELLSPYQFYQYLIGVADADVIRLMKMLTFVDLDEISEMEAAMSRPDYVPNSAQRRLAAEVTRFVHGEEGLEEALRATRALSPGAKTTKLDVAALTAIAGDVPTIDLDRSAVVGRPLVDVAVHVGLFPSKGAVRRLIKQGGVYLNNEKVEEEDRLLRDVDVIGDTMFLLSSGKKKKVIARVLSSSSSSSSSSSG
ncbi:hypothetical protein CBR_g10848 [Chara braunii]|uniref:tyrosine--tRNA ligase n=1 Tax=Chara braunii TaxID=69332 RepID=A0A388KPD9_CHABU|nr:hypothetical protein CBR_g10848 [Chara braunii]|eukprot:GBG71912.1 hypothetical protein CBR_g10848 [Chara braunii]